MPADEDRAVSDVWLGVFREVIPAGSAGVRRLEEIPDDVPSRESGARTAAHRERYCLVRMLRALAQCQPALFPMQVERLAPGASPDFVLTDASGRVVAVEHTDAGTEEYQRFLSCAGDDVELDWSPASPRGRGRSTLPVPPPPAPPDRYRPRRDGWVGDAPIERLMGDVLTAVERKSAQKVWRDAPPTADRVLLVYCQVPIVCIFDADEFPAALERGKGFQRGLWGPSRLVILHANRIDFFAWNQGGWAIDRLSSDEVVP